MVTLHRRRRQRPQVELAELVARVLAQARARAVLLPLEPKLVLERRWRSLGETARIARTWHCWSKWRIAALAVLLLMM